MSMPRLDGWTVAELVCESDDPMARIPRKLLFGPTEVGVYHCINRCVRRARLMGDDPDTDLK